MQCKGKFDNSNNNIFKCDFNDTTNEVYIYRDDFGVTITREMFDELYETI